jgi:hypothetical protein
MTNRFEAVLGDDDILCWEVIEWYMTNEEGTSKVGRTIAKFYGQDDGKFRAEMLAQELQEEYNDIMEWENFMNTSCREESDFGC